MVDNHLNKFYHHIKNIVINDELMTESQISHLQIQSTVSKNIFFTEIFAQHWLNNELLLKFLQHKYQKFFINQQELRRLKILFYHQADCYLTNGYLLCQDHQGVHFIIINNLIALDHLNNIDIEVHVDIHNIKFSLREDFYYLFEYNFTHLITVRAKYLLNFYTFGMTAQNIRYRTNICSFLVLFFASFWILPNFFYIINHLLYLTTNLLKMLLFKRALATGNTYKPRCIVSLPIYTILVPLYQEQEKLTAILTNISLLNYPKQLLDVKIIIESDDLPLIANLDLLNLHFSVQIIKVPHSLPRTKPKALNYAMQYTRGQYTVIYDAEDKPDADQLLKALQAFAALPPEYACVQAKLNFYNASENLLTRFFSMEYRLWFDYILKGLSISNLPVLLGGTSNHFKTNVLQNVGYWDSYNVTEDADLGIRLYMHGYKVHIIDSYTLEESPISIRNWLRQRSRWVKGFIQTFLVFIKYSRVKNNLTFRQSLIVYLLTGVSCYSFYCFPWLVLLSSYNLVKNFDYLWIANSLGIFLYLYATTLYVLINTKNLPINHSFASKFAIILWPCYFLLHVIASHKALWDLLIQPFTWNKTEHGVSNTELRK